MVGSIAGKREESKAYYQNRGDEVVLILCMEKDKYKNRRPVYSIVKRSVENRDINFFAMRCRFNPELRYYITRLDEEKTDEEIMAMFRQNKYRKEPLFAKIGD